MEIKTIGLASDHAAFPLKQFVKQYLEEKGIEAFIKPGNFEQISTKKFAAQIGSIVPESEHESGKRA